MRALTIFVVLALAAALAVPVAAHATAVTGNITVEVAVLPSCKWVSAQNIDFNFYDPVNANSTAPLDAIGSVTLRCGRGGSYMMALGQGLNPAAGSTCLTPLRQLKAYDWSPDAFLRYDIYQDAARTHVWGCDNANRLMIGGSSALTDFDVPLYGRIPGGQDPASDYTLYGDAVQVTVTF